MENRHKTINKVFSTALLLLASCLFLMLLGAGHRLDSRDFGQMKLVAEIIILFVTGTVLLTKKGMRIALLSMVLLFLVQLVFFDLVYSLKGIDFDPASKPIVYFVASTLLVIDAYVCFVNVKALRVAV